MYIDILKRFQENIKAIRVFVEFVEPVLRSESITSMNNSTTVFLNELYMLYKTQPEAFAEELLKKNNLDGIFKFMSDIFLFMEEKLIEMGSISDRNELIDMLKQEEYQRIQTIKNSSIDIEAFKKQDEILYKSSLMNLVIYFENMLSEIFRIQFSRYPETIGLQEKSLSYRQIQELGSFEEANKFLVEREVETMMRGNFDEWLKFFTKSKKLNLKHVHEMKIDVIELFTRRNLFVHNSGVVNTIYLGKVGHKYSKDLKNGDKLKVDREYIHNALNLIERIGYIIIFENWYQEDRNNIHFQETFLQVGYELLKNENYSTAIEVYRIVKEDKRFEKLELTFRLTVELNFLLCMKEMNMFDTFTMKIMKLDFSSNGLGYQLPLLALKEDYKNFFKLLPKGCPSEITLSYLKEWPIFKNIRKQKEYEEFISLYE